MQRFKPLYSPTRLLRDYIRAYIEIIEFNSEAEMERVLRCSRKTVLKGRTTKNGYKLLENFEEENVETIESIT